MDGRLKMGHEIPSIFPFLRRKSFMKQLHFLRSEISKQEVEIKFCTVAHTLYEGNSIMTSKTKDKRQ